MSGAPELGTFVAVSSVNTKLCQLDGQGKPSYPWQDSGQQAHTSVNWLRNGKAFIVTQGSTVLVHVMEQLKEKAAPILALPAGSLLCRVSGDGKCLVLVQSEVPGAVYVYDMQSLLAAGAGTVPPKQPVVLQDHDQPILALAASIHTTHVASSNAAGLVYLHEAGAGKRKTMGLLPSGPALVTPKRCLAFSQNVKPLRLAAGADDGQVLVWQIDPSPLGPVLLPAKLRGRVMGVGFAAYLRAPSSVLLACSESGQLSVTDMRPFPNLQASFTVELSVAVSCMVVREDGMAVAVGTKDGRVGYMRVDDILSHKQGMTKLGLIKVFDLGTHLDVADIAFQRHKESRESREDRESRGSPATTPASGMSHPQQRHPTPVDGTAESRQSGSKEEPSASARASAKAQALLAGSKRPSTTDKQPETSVARSGSVGSGAGGPASVSARSQAGAGAPAAAAGRSAAAAHASGPAAGATPSSSQHPAAPSAGTTTAAGAGSTQVGRQPVVPTLIIPGVAPPPAGQRRPSDLAGTALPTAGGSGVAEETPVGPDGQPSVSPAARALLAGAVGVNSPVGSPSRARSPRVSTSTAGAYPPGRLPMVSSGGADAQMSLATRAYLDDFRQEMRDMMRGLQVDMVRQLVALEMRMEMVHRNDMEAVMAQNQQLRDEVARLSQQLDAALRFSVLDQQRGPW